MTTLKTEEMSCNHCVERIQSALKKASIAHEISLENKTVLIEDSDCVSKAVDILDDLGFSAVEV